MKPLSFAACAAVIMMLAGNSAMAADDHDITALKAEIASMKQSYETRIAGLEAKLKLVEGKQEAAITPQKPAIPTSTGRSGGPGFDNSFNPAIGVILNGTYGAFSSKDSHMAGFAVPGEGARQDQGLKLGESEINFVSNIDDKFSGNLTASFTSEKGEDQLGIEEAFVQTLPGMGLPSGLSVKAGRALWTLGYLNEQHAHTDDFVDRPLPYRVFLGNAYNDDGAEVSYILPTAIYSEVGGGVFRGDVYPFGSNSGRNPGAWSAFARIGNDIGDNQTWRVGAYTLSGNAHERLSNDDTVIYNGNSHLYIADVRYTFAPTGNSNEKELTLQSEVFRRNENGNYEDTAASSGQVGTGGHASGWYAQGVYKFLPSWRAGVRYSQLISPSTPLGLLGSALDSSSYNPKAYAAMVDWSNSEFSRIRLQYNYEELARGQVDNQFLAQYIMSLGAHGAHKY